jgi:L-ascorbate metabolism protein UlaG (beta-lactamase superfamily)
VRSDDVTAEPSPLERLRHAAVPAGGVGLVWLGQAGFVLRTPTATAMLDPFLSPYRGREYESALAPADASGVDVVLCTHEHVDHLDAASLPAITTASPGAVFVVPTPIVDMAIEAGVAPDRVVGMQPGELLELPGLSVRAVPAMHGVTMEDAYGFGEELSGGLIRFLGYVVDAGGVRLYHAGDTILFAGMEDTLRDLGVAVAMLPINGRDPGREARGIVGNLSEREAAWLAGAIGAEVVVPMHYDLFARNRGYPEWLVESVSRDHRGVHVLVPTRDVPFGWTSAR